MLREPYTGQVFQARGAVAVSSASKLLDSDIDSLAAEALRMILVGPGGTTALDLWSRGEQFRLSIPALSLLKRGTTATPRSLIRGFPMDFLRWWLLRPVGGKLLWYQNFGSVSAFVLRDGNTIVDLRISDDGQIYAHRNTWISSSGHRHLVEEEFVVADHINCGTVHYVQVSTGLFVKVICEAEERNRSPDARAFIDPDSGVPDGGSHP